MSNNTSRSWWQRLIDWLSASAAGRPELPIISHEAAKWLFDPRKSQILHRAQDNYWKDGDGTFARAEAELIAEKRIKP